MVNQFIRRDFPIFASHPGLVYLDNAATTQKPRVVIDAEKKFYESSYANVHRGVYRLAVRATDVYERVRAKLAALTCAGDAAEIVFAANATAALNTIAWIQMQRLRPGDEILLSVAEHHSNILPWQRAAQSTGARLVWVDVGSDGTFDMKDFYRKLTPSTKIVAVFHISNVLGSVAPLVDITKAAHRVGAQVVVDAAQSAGRMHIDVQAFDVDYMVFSAHKMYGPSGVGFFYGRREFLENAQPLLVGGGTVEHVTAEGVEWRATPHRFEAGTPNVAGVAALEAAIDYLTKVSLDAVWRHEQELVIYALERLRAISGLTLWGPMTAKQRAGIFSFSLRAGDTALHSHDVAEIADRHGVALRGGNHCAQPLLDSLGVSDLVRASFGIYNTIEDVDRLVEALEDVQRVFGKSKKKKEKVKMNESRSGGTRLL